MWPNTRYIYTKCGQNIPIFRPDMASKSTVHFLCISITYIPFCTLYIYIYTFIEWFKPYVNLCASIHLSLRSASLRLWRCMSAHRFTRAFLQVVGICISNLILLLPINIKFDIYTYDRYQIWYALKQPLAQYWCGLQRF